MFNGYPMVIAWKQEISLSYYTLKRVSQSKLLTPSSEDRDWASGQQNS